MPRHNVIILSGPSGSGKTTLYKKILNDFVFAKILAKTVSYTTRLPRQGEINGLDYFFISRVMFDYKIRAKHFLEHETFFGHSYGTARKNVKDILSQKNALLCIDVKGAKTVRKHFPQAISFFIKAPNLQELKKRLMVRGSESTKELVRRIERVKEELKHADEYDYIFINDDLDVCYQKLKSVLIKKLS